MVGGITGIRVWETLPDTFFDRADEVMLVDIPADELLGRLKAGKVYVPEQADRASKSFFRKGNLIALRELALRRTADRVEEDVQSYRTKQAIERVWKTEASFLCCIGPRPGGEHVVRSAARLATQLNVDWTAVYVETPALQRLPSGRRERILRTLKLAQDLGANTAILSGSDAPSAIVEYARNHNISKLIFGRSPRRSLLPWRISFGTRLAALAPDVDFVEIARGDRVVPAPEPVDDALSAGSPDAKAVAMHLRYLWAAAACLLPTLIGSLLHPYFDPANIVMLFLLTVVIVAVAFGRGPAVLTTLLGVASFDFFFVPPHLSFAVSDVQYLLTFVVMLAVGLITGQLTAGLRYQARVASHREERSRALYEFARDLSSPLRAEDVVATTADFIGRTFRAKVALLLPDYNDRLAYAPHASPALPIDLGTAQWAFDRSQPAGAGTDTLPGNEFLYLPLRAPMRTRGVLAIRPDSRRLLLVPEQRRQLDTFAALVAIALERVHYVEVAQQALIKMESERLRNSLLSALSHDLRTPLAALFGLADSLKLTKPPLSEHQQDIANAIREAAQGMSALVNNLLDMARIQSGEVRLNLQWQPFEEVVGGALKSTQTLLAHHRVEVDLEQQPPLVEFDAVLIERVLSNLLENAAKYTPAGSTIRLTAATSNKDLLVSRYRQRPRVAEGPGGSHLREVHARRARVGDIRCRAGPRYLPRHRRSAQGEDLGREQPCRGSQVLVHAAARHTAGAPAGHRRAAPDRRRLSHERAGAGRGTDRRRAADPPLRARCARIRGLERVRLRDPEAGPGRGRHAQARSHRPRPRPAGWRRRGFHPRVPRLVADPDHRALGTCRRNGQDRSAGCGSRRLSDQAVRGGRAAGESASSAAAADPRRKHRQAVRAVR